MADTLLDAVQRYTDAHPGQSLLVTPIDGMAILRSDQTKRPAHRVFKPQLCVVVQGTKQSLFGDRQFEYRAGQALLVTVEMPTIGRVIEASPDKPYLGIVLAFDLAMMHAVREELATPPQFNNTGLPGVFVADFEGPLSDCVLRLMHLLDTPQAIPMLAPLIMREICYWLLTGPNGGEIAQMTLGNSHEPNVIRAVHALRDRFAEPIRVEDLARIAGMSISAFHRQFKAVTSLSPLQYQKQLRLLEARRLMASEAANVEMAAFQVGYESPSQFSREYSRMFGAPPRRDIVALREQRSSTEGDTAHVKNTRQLHQKVI